MFSRFCCVASKQVAPNSEMKRFLARKRITKTDSTPLKDTEPYEMEYYQTNIVEKGYFFTFFAQLVIMLKRNYTLQLRFMKSTVAQTIVAPILFMVCLLVLQSADYANQGISNLTPLPSTLNGVLRCTNSPNKGCINFMYSPNAEPFNSILQSFSQKNALRTEETPFAFSTPMSGKLQNINNS